MPQPQLPTEPLRTIIAEVALSKGGTRADLAACCLVSRTILPLAREELYRVVSVSVLSSQHQWPLVSPERLLATIVSNPHIAAGVKRLEITRNDGAPARAVRSTADALVDACERLEQLQVNCSSLHNEVGTGWLERLVEKRGKTLQALEVRGHYHWSNILFVDMLLHLPRLQNLHIFSPPHIAHNSDSSPIFRLQTFELFHPAQPALLDMLLGASQETLKTLDLYGIHTGAVYDFSAFNSLHLVRLTCQYFDMPRADVVRLFQSLGSAPSPR